MARLPLPMALGAVLALAGGDAAPAQASTENDANRADETIRTAVRVLPVTACTTGYGAGAPSGAFVARRLSTSASNHRFRFSANRLITVLGPRGWGGGALVAAVGGEKIELQPPGTPSLTVWIPPCTLPASDASLPGHRRRLRGTEPSDRCRGGLG